MQEIIVKINETTEKIIPSMVFHSRNPISNRYHVNIYYMEDDREGNTVDKEKWVQLFCQEVYQETPAKELAISIREGKITDLTGYLAERRL